MKAKTMKIVISNNERRTDNILVGESLAREIIDMQNGRCETRQVATFSESLLTAIARLRGLSAGDKLHAVVGFSGAADTETDRVAKKLGFEADGPDNWTVSCEGSDGYSGSEFCSHRNAVIPRVFKLVAMAAKPKTPGEIAYNAHQAKTRCSIAWHERGEVVRAAWDRAAQAVLDSQLKPGTIPGVKFTAVCKPEFKLRTEDAAKAAFSVFSPGFDWDDDLTYEAREKWRKIVAICRELAD